MISVGVCVCPIQVSLDSGLIRWLLFTAVGLLTWARALHPSQPLGKWLKSGRYTLVRWMGTLNGGLRGRFGTGTKKTLNTLVVKELAKLASGHLQSTRCRVLDDP